MLNDAAKLGVTVAVEPVAAHTLNSPALAARLLQEFRGGGLAAIFDAVNLLTPARIETRRRRCGTSASRVWPRYRGTRSRKRRLW